MTRAYLPVNDCFDRRVDLGVPVDGAWRMTATLNVVIRNKHYTICAIRTAYTKE